MGKPRWWSEELVEEVKRRKLGRRLVMNEFGFTEHKARVIVDAAARLSDLPEPPPPPPEPHIIEMFTDAVRTLPSLQVKRTRRPVLDAQLDPEDLILHISDAQVGSVVSPAATGGLGGYNFEIFQRRAERYRTAVQKILRYVPNKIDNCHVVFGGDLVDGRTIFRGQQRQTELGVTQQVIAAYETFAHFLADIMEMGFDEVVVTGVPGNHGRIGKWGELGPEDNLDLLLLYFLRERFKGVDGIRFNIPETWWALLNIKGWRFLIAHGDEFKSWLKIPFYGALGFKSRMRELLRESFPREWAAEADFDFILAGHHHEQAAFGNILLNGCWPGGSEFSLKTLQVGGLPYQRICGVHETIGISWDRKIVLEDRRSLQQPVVFR
jgi:hypothetical protein